MGRSDDFLANKGDVVTFTPKKIDYFPADVIRQAALRPDPMQKPRFSEQENYAVVRPTAGALSTPALNIKDNNEDGFGSDKKLVVAVTSAHFGGKTGYNYNQFNPSEGKYISNPGVGFNFKTGVDMAGSPLRTEVGAYNNSFYKSTSYAALEWKPLEANLPLGLKGSFGGVAGLATGYEEYVPKEFVIGKGIVPVVAARMSIEGERMGVDATVIPPAGKNMPTVLAISATFKF
ncbi:MAG: hypothetical protein A3J37_05720 [Alphaproteobacteria bacterium RIFCSPHIGHO2_12_FULL_45_9]|nr:MAG: hypothetical protein A3B66_05920 [Alphaproteobacteria bacterium RIFCSPHIGHO2_02_FULL_46_13]OFW97894.1 MAG: hypothetical protein A3J37_05720 [Alphaproteobacteria bacterium RIFCSPHIGHO2_12_FULL_45_9]